MPADPQACDCAWLFGLRGRLGQLLGTGAREPGGAAHLPRLLVAAADSAPLLRHCSPAPEEQVGAAALVQCRYNTCTSAAPTCSAARRAAHVRRASSGRAVHAEHQRVTCH